MRNLIAAALVLFCAANTGAAADEASCAATPTRACVFGLAGETIGTVAVVSSQADSQRSVLVWQTWKTLVETAARTGDTDLALSLASRIPKGVDGMDLGDLVVAMELAGRHDDLTALLGRLGQNARAYDYRLGPALVEKGRTADFDLLAKTRNYPAYEVISMQAAGHLMAGRTDEAMAVLRSLNGVDRINALNATLSKLQTEHRLGAGAPVLALEDLKTMDGVRTCASVASASRDRTLAERCFSALSALPYGTTRESDFGGIVAPQVAEALAAAGEWRQAVSLVRDLPDQNKKAAFTKVVQASRSPDFVPSARTALAGDSKDFPRRERGRIFVRLLEMAGQRSEAIAFVAAAPDDPTRDDWSLAQAEAMAESGGAKEAFEVARTIKDPALRVRGLCAVARGLI